MRVRSHTRSHRCVVRLASCPVPASASQKAFTARSRVLIVSLSVAGFLSGCSATPPHPLGPDAANPAMQVNPAVYRSAIGGYVSQRPVAPGDWRQQNERVAPPPRSGD
jgi:hypothetical protein